MSFKLCIDPGHGFGNKSAKLYDPGAVSQITKLKEADIVLKYGHCLREACEALRLPVFMTRRATNDFTPLGTRTVRALENGCTHLISLHVNQGDDVNAHGYETLWRTEASARFARDVHAQVISVLGLRDRGLKKRTDLAVLGSSRLQSTLLEFGFIDNAEDMAAITNPVVMRTVCGTLAKLLAEVAKMEAFRRA